MKIRFVNELYQSDCEKPGNEQVYIESINLAVKCVIVS